MASPAIKRSAASIPNTPADSHSLNGIASSTSPNGSTAGVTPQSFSIDTFDFATDFSLPSNLDDLGIFPRQERSNEVHSNHQVAIAALPSSKLSQASGSIPSPEGSSSTNKKDSITSRLSKQRSTGFGAHASSSNNSIIESPRSVHFSPRTSMREQLMQVAQSSQQSPHALQMMSNEEETTSLNVDELQNLLHAIDSQAPHQAQQRQAHHNNHQQQNGIGELERLLAEKEQVERMQNLQTAFLRQQIEALQRQNPGAAMTGVEQNATGAVSGDVGSSSTSAAQLMQQFQQLSSQQSPSASMANMSFTSPFAFSQPQQSPFSSNAVKPGMPTNVNQYGLITPVSSDAFAYVQQQAPLMSPLSMPGTSGAQMMTMQRSHDHGRLVNGSFTPLESPAITPASVFSNMGSSSTSADLFSPLTSPALRPQSNAHDPLAMQLSPFIGPIKGRPKGRGAPGTSPNASTVTKSVPRKNRSTTAEARANRARASPLVKPTLPSSIAQTTRKRNESINGATMPSPLGPNVPVNASRTHSRRASQTDTETKQTPSAFPPLGAGSGSAKPLDASPSEAAASTPSPIEMPPPNGKPLTPSSLMGIKGSSSNTEQGGNLSRASSLRNAQKASKSTEKQISFAQFNEADAHTLHNIVPGTTPVHERESWVASVKANGTGGLESRRTSHKAAEQKRRDSLKYCFDELRGMLPAITLDDDVPGGSMLGPDGLLEDQEPEAFTIEEVGDAESARIANRAISKVALLRHSNEYLYRLKHRIGRRERDLANCRREIMELRARLGIHIPPEWTALTASMAGSAAVMGHNMSNILNLDALAEQTHPHQAAILISAMQHQRQQQLQGTMADYPQNLDGTNNFATMDTST